MMGENVKKETVDYLPLGSVVILKGGVQKVVVIARGFCRLRQGKKVILITADVCTRKDWSEIRSYILITEIS